MIPKIVHYCWFGGDKPKMVQECMSTWTKLDDYKFIEWDESNCDFCANEFVREAAKNKKWGYIGDYFRYKALYELGGVYMDTDVKVINKFDDLLNYSGVFGHIYDSLIGTAVIAFEPHHPLIKTILGLYERAVWVDDYSIRVTYPSGKKAICNVSDNVLTGMLLEYYREFKLDGKKQVMHDNVLILPKEDFQLGYVKKGEGYSIHLCFGAWDKMSVKRKVNWTIRRSLSYLPFINWDILARSISYNKRKEMTPFADIYYKNLKNSSRTTK